MTLASFQTKYLHVIAAYLLALLLWFVMFVLKPAPFWPMMTISTGILGGWALWKRPDLLWQRHNIAKSITTGVVSAGVLYGIFFTGHVIFQRLYPGEPGNIAEIYALRGDHPPWILIVTLLVIIGPGEELFWRGYIQAFLDTRLPAYLSVSVTASLYAAVHLFSHNAMLLLAAFAGGIFWGLLYQWRQTILPVIISHAVWDILIFVLFPIR